MPHKIISRITSRVEKIRHTVVEEAFPLAVNKAKATGATVVDGAKKARGVAESAINTTAEKVKSTELPNFATVKKDAENTVAEGLKQVSEIEWKKEFGRIKNLDLPALTKLKPIDWTAEHIRMWDEDKDKETSSDALNREPQPHKLVSGPQPGFTTLNKEDGSTEFVRYKGSEEGAPVKTPASSDEIIHTSVSKPRKGKTDGVVIAELLEKETKDALLAQISEGMNDTISKEDDKLSLDASKSKKSPAKKPAKKVSAVSRDKPQVISLGAEKGQIEPLGTEYKKIIRKVAKQAEVNSEVKLYLSGKTYGIGARGTTENIDGNDVSVFDAKDIKKLLAKIS